MLHGDPFWWLYLIVVSVYTASITYISIINEYQ